MAHFLRSSGINNGLESLIVEAKSFITVVSPYYRISEELALRFKSACQRGVKLSLIYGKKELDQEQIQIIGEIGRVELFYLQDLHAKCYINDSSVIITSMNLHEYSQHINWEMGVLVHKQEESQFYCSALSEVEQIMKAAEKRQLFRAERHASNGSCIRCRTKIEYNPEHPLCTSCYKEWSVYANPHFIERFCHSCGQKWDTTIDYPECTRCYQHNHRKIG